MVFILMCLVKVNNHINFNNNNNHSDKRNNRKDNHYNDIISILRLFHPSSVEPVNRDDRLGPSCGHHRHRHRMPPRTTTTTTDYLHVKRQKEQGKPNSTGTVAIGAFFCFPPKPAVKDGVGDIIIMQRTSFGYL